MLQIYIRICIEKGKQNIKEYEKQCRKNMSEEDKQNEKESMKEYKKSIQQFVEENKRKQRAENYSSRYSN